MSKGLLWGDKVKGGTILRLIEGEIILGRPPKSEIISFNFYLNQYHQKIMNQLSS